MSSNNPAAAQGWVKSTDPKTGRVFYANHRTRKTQWDPPDNWVESVLVAPPPVEDDSDEEILPSNWEMMHDPATGKPFYVDHERQITTWKRPKGIKKSKNFASSGSSYYNDSNSTSNDSGGGSTLLEQYQQLQQQQQQYQQVQQKYQQSNSSSKRSYQQEAAYYNSFGSYTHHHHQETVDFSDTLPSLEFSVKKVADALRPNCPHCNCTFSLSKRRHHCRLCGDVFCDPCSNHRVELPLEGPEFEAPVRVCDFCFQDVERGNFFSMRRYLTPLQLYDSSSKEDNEVSDPNAVATYSNVNAALDALTTDLNQMLNNPTSDTDYGEKLKILPTSIFITALVKHISYLPTSNRAIRALSSLLALENVAGQKQFAQAIYFYGGKGIIDDILGILERSGDDRKTLFVQEQAARTMFYLSDPNILTSLEAKRNELIRSEKKKADDEKDIDEDDYGGEESLDLSRTLRSMLDHSSDSKNPNLQRWATSCVRNLILEDQRRACLAVNEFAASIASGHAPKPISYESFLDNLVNSGGIMILCTLIGADDSDTRAHATAALGASIEATRAMDASLAALSEMTGGKEGSSEQKDGRLVRAILAGGGCGASVSQLLLSADHTVAGMGCNFIASLVLPLLTLATGNLPTQYDCHQDQDVMGACREAALEITTGSCLPALISLVREGSGGTGTVQRPIELRKCAMETLAASVLAVGEMGKAWANGKYEEGLELSHAPSKLKQAMMLLNEEGLIDTVIQVLLESSTGQSLGSSQKDTPSSRIREAAGMILAAVTSCSAQAIMDLQTRHYVGSNGVSGDKPAILSQLLLSSNDSSFTTTPSTFRADAAPRCLGVLETVSSVLMFAWQHPSGAASELLDRLIEVLDAGVISYLSNILSVKIDWESNDKAVGGMKARSACFKLLCCLFGIALTDETTIGMKRLMDAVDGDAMQNYYYQQQQHSRSSRSSSGPNNIIEATLGSLQVASSNARKALMGSVSVTAHYHAALMDMLEAALLATGSMCGSSIAPGGGEGTLIKGENFLTLRNDPFVSRRKSICSTACDVVVRAGGRSGSPALLPTMLVGGFGEGSVLASLRLSLAIAQNGSKEQHAKLAISGILVPISDLLRTALSNGDLYKFSSALTLVRFCGPYIATGIEGGGLQSVRDAIKVATNVLTLPLSPNSSIEQIETHELIKAECISALEALSRNAALWSAISTDALPSMVTFLQSNTNDTSGVNSNSVMGQRRKETRSAALSAVLQIVQVPSHAVSAAEAGIVEPLGKLLKNAVSATSTLTDNNKVDLKVPILALQVLHVISKNPESRRKARLLDMGVVRSVCAVLGNVAVTSSPNKIQPPSNSNSDRNTVAAADLITVLGLDIIHYVMADIDHENNYDATNILQSQAAIAFLDAIASEPIFVKALCSTLLLKTGMTLKRHDAESNDSDWGSSELTYDVPPVYGPALRFLHGEESKRCGGSSLYDDTHEAASAVLFTVAVYACAIESRRSLLFWNVALLKADEQKTTKSIESDKNDPLDHIRTALTFCAQFLSLLDTDYKPFIPLTAMDNNSNQNQSSSRKEQDYLTIIRPLIRHRLLEALKDCLDQGASVTATKANHTLSDYNDDSSDEGNKESDPYIVSVLVNFNVPQICLSLWKDPALLDLAFGLMKQILVQIDPDEVLHLFVATKEGMLSLFDLLNLNESNNNTTNVVEIRKFLASILGKLADNGLLASAVKRFDVRSSAIGALAAACLMEEDTASPKKKQNKSSSVGDYGGYGQSHDDDDSDDNHNEHDDEEEEDMTSNRLSSGLMRCLVELCTVQEAPSPRKNDNKNITENNKKRKIILSSAEAEAIARNLGKKICHMVLSRFLERAKLQQYEMHDDEDENIMDAPDIAMLCAIVQHPEALKTIRSFGGLAALSQIASEGELSALLALKKACEEDSSILLEADTFLAVMNLFSEENDHASWKSEPLRRRQLEAVAFEMLGQLCRTSQKGRKAVANSNKCGDCASKAIEVVSSMIFTALPPPPYPAALPPPTAPPEDYDEDSEEDTEKDNVNDGGDSSDDDGDGDAISKDSGNNKVGAQPKEEIPEDKEHKAIVTAPPGSDDALELVNIEEAELAVSCLLFLSAVVPVISVRNEMLKDEIFIKASCAIATLGAQHHRELQFEAVKLFVSLAPYAATSGVDGVLSVERVASVLHSVLQCESGAKFSFSASASNGKLNTNLLYSTAVSGIQIVFDSLQDSTQVAIAETILTRFAKLVKSVTAARTAAASEKDRQNGGELAYILLSTLLLARGKPPVQGLFFTPQVLTSLIHVVQWRYDPKTKMDENNTDCKNKIYWNASVTHCLQILSLTLWSSTATKSNEDLLKMSKDSAKTNKKKKKTVIPPSDAYISFDELSKTVLMVARPGKAPRKAIDLHSALTRAIESCEQQHQRQQKQGIITDAAAGIAAQRVLDRLF